MDVKSTISKASELIKARSFEQAIPLLKDLISTDTDNELALGMLASIYAEIDMQEKARSLYSRILELNPANPLARFQLGLNYFNANQIKEALEIWEPGLADKTDFMTKYFTALAYIQLKQYEKAKGFLVQTEKIMPKDHPLYSELTKLTGTEVQLH